MIDLRLGDYRTALADVGEVDAVICDPPYSERTHSGQRSGSRPLGGGGRKATITYARWSAGEMEALAAWAAAKAKKWCVVFSDHAGFRSYEAAFEDAGWYVFAPVLWVRENPPPRLSGDGPTSAADYICVARPRARVADPGSRPGYYIHQASAHSLAHVGGKPLDLMRAIVRDYTRPGDLVCDPTAGGGTTLLAAWMEGRRAIGAELDPATHAKAMKRLTDAQKQQPLFTARTQPKQERLL